MSLDENEIKKTLDQFKDPETGRGIVSTGQLQNLQIDAATLTATLALTTHSAPIWDETQSRFVDFVKANVSGIENVSIELSVFERPPEKIGQLGLTAKSVIAVGSGKGCVGKSTVSACLALALKNQGCAVGLMDADVYGPSIPHLLGIDGRPEVTTDKKMTPIYYENLPTMSMGFLVPPGEAVVWRGPMLHGAITQFLRDTMWGNLDYLIIDLPPGTGDIALTLSQSLPLTGSVVVCTPQEVALLDAVKAIAMFEKVKIPVLGVVENMSGFLCPDCNKRYDIFGSGGAKKKAEELKVPFLGEVPINVGIRENGDAGKTAEVLNNSATAEYFLSIARTIVRNQADSAENEPPQFTLPVLG